MQLAFKVYDMMFDILVIREMQNHINMLWLEERERKKKEYIRSKEGYFICILGWNWLNSNLHRYPQSITFFQFLLLTVQYFISTFTSGCFSAELFLFPS